MHAQADSEIADIKMKLHQLVSSSESSESDIMATMDMLKTKYADYGKDRTSAAVFHLDELQVQVSHCQNHKEQCCVEPIPRTS
jgi:hypothetical protein